ncbi:MAG TPA: DnaJ domain-containing protein [Ignavibacteriales bacterium]|nr:DnaJ domain-containing protein [Ignavibacteriales bacterium]
MGDILKLRDAADLLFSMDRYEEAFDVYDEVYSQIWSALASVQNGLSEFSFGFLTHNIRQAIDFKNHFLVPAVNTVFLKWFNQDIDQTLTEFIYSASGRLQCICLSDTLLERVPASSVVIDYIILYNLVLNSSGDKWISHLFKLVTPVADSNRLKKIRLNLGSVSADMLIIESAEKVRQTEWNNINLTLLDYLNKTTGMSELYQSISALSGKGKWEKHSRNHKKKETSGRHAGKGSSRESSSEESSSEERNSSGKTHSGKYSSGRNSSGRNSSSNAGSDSYRFSYADSSDEEKTRYFGSVLGLRGKVTKSEIRKKYIDEMAKYHPDKVASLGEELIDLAERKTKEINMAYEWLKMKFKL